MDKAPTILLTAAIGLALLVLPATAGAEYFIPDGNSAVNQYTEGIPTGGGEKSAKDAGEKPVRPAQTIGAKNTKKLEQAGGEEGREAAEVAAETAPPTVVEEEPASAGGQSAGGGERDGKNAGGKQRAGGDRTVEEPEEATAPAAPAFGDGPGGSGGLGEVLSAATGGSGGGIGLLLPLVLVAAVAWGAAYAWHKRDSGPSPTPSK